MAGINFRQLRQDAMTVLEGEFPAVLSECTAVTNSKGNPMFKCKFKIANGPYANRPVWNNINITPDSQFAMKIFFRHMAALGISDAFLDADPTTEQIAAKLTGANCIIKLKKGSYQGNEREEVEDILPAFPSSVLPGAGGMLTGAVALPVALAPAKVVEPDSLPGDPLPAAVEIVPEVPAADPPQDPTDQGPDAPPLPF